MHHLLKDVTKIQNGTIHGMIHGMNKFKEKLRFINVALFYQYNTFHFYNTENSLIIYLR